MNDKIQGQGAAQPEGSAAANPETAVSQDEVLRRKKELLDDLDELVTDLRASIPQAGENARSPMFFISFIQTTIERMTPDVQLGILESFEGMTQEDVMDIETWKGMAYMFSYSARFQAGQVKDKMNENMPPPLQPDTSLNFMKQTLDRFTPEIAKNIMETFQDATREDLLDIDTWKGIWTMLAYSMQFEMNKFRETITGESEED